MVPDLQPSRLSGEDQDYAIKTWRYLRLAMVALFVGLIVSIVFEWWKVDQECLQTSISAYYYTPVHGYFVGALVSIGVCLFCLKGSTDAEDVLLNFAGMFALVVALVPTPDTGYCASVLGTAQDRDVNIANNVTALLAVGGLGLLILIGALKNRHTAPLEFVAYVIGVGVLAATAFFFWEERESFVRNTHWIAAVLMFICILVVVCINARDSRRRTQRNLGATAYAVVAVAMVASSIGIYIAGRMGWDHWIIAIEFALIVLFIGFWLIQTVELWNQGLRD